MTNKEIEAQFVAAALTGLLSGEGTGESRGAIIKKALEIGEEVAMDFLDGWGEEN